MNAGDVVDDLVIDALDDEGRGRGVAGDWDIAVRGALPGDVVRARVERTFPARTLAQAVAVAHQERGSLHVERRCAHHAPCPGCPFEGVDRGVVRALKRERVVQALVDAGLAEHVHLVEDVEPARAPRQKAKLTAGGATGGLELGLFVPYSHDLRPATACPHQDARLSRAFHDVKAALDELRLPPATLDPRGVKAVVARAFVEGVGVVVVTGAPFSDEQWRVLCARALSPVGGSDDGGDDGADVGGGAEDPARVISLAVRVDEGRTNSIVSGAVERTAGPQALTPLEGGAATAVDAFCQTDPLLAAEMYRRTADFLVDDHPAARRTFADLYAGAGGFARALLARGAGHVVAVERAEASAQALAQLERTEAMVSAVEAALPVLAARSFAGVVADPPKSGLRDIARDLAALDTSRLVLVACDPDAGARDVKVLLDAGYRLARVEPLDLFPATPEIETVFYLEAVPARRD